MATGTGRDGRRRRVLNDGARASAAAPTADSGPVEPAAKRRRFAPDDASVSFAIARGVLPTSPWRLTLAVGGALVLVALCVVGHLYHTLLPAALAPLANVQAPTSVAQWLTGLMTTTAGVLCLVVYGLRSSRTDDVRGLYRWWLTAGVGCLLVSGLLATGAHEIAAGQLVEATGVAVLGGAIWWVVPAALAFLALAIRPLGDLRESAVSLTFSIAASGCLVVSTLAHLRVLPGVAEGHATSVASGALMACLVFAMAAQLRYIRRVLLETDGRLSAPKAKVKKPAPAAKPVEAKANTAASAPSPKTQPKAQPQPQPKPAAAAKPAAKAAQVKVADESRWTDGSDADDQHYDDDQPRRKLSKAERKRLRKQKAGGRYAA